MTVQQSVNDLANPYWQGAETTRGFLRSLIFRLKWFQLGLGEVENFRFNLGFLPLLNIDLLSPHPNSVLLTVINIEHIAAAGGKQGFGKC